MIRTAIKIGMICLGLNLSILTSCSDDSTTDNGGGTDSETDTLHLKDSANDSDTNSVNDSDTNAVNDSDTLNQNNKPGELTGTLRDFHSSHPDFEYVVGAEEGIVKDLLGSDKKPVYAGNDVTKTTTGADNFNQWYNDVADVNMSMPYTITLTNDGNGLFYYDNQEFFPLDDQLFGNEENPHNYHFTYELHTSFTYKGGEIFRFIGDDDLFVFINGHLAIDLGGVHGPLDATADLDALAADLKIEPGKTYSLDFFFAERHTVQSTFRIETTISDLSGVIID